MFMFMNHEKKGAVQADGVSTTPLGSFVTSAQHERFISTYYTFFPKSRKAVNRARIALGTSLQPRYRPIDAGKK